MTRFLLLALLLAAVPALAQDDAAADREDATYVGSQTCVDCHEDAAAAWTGSHHDLAWTEPGPDTVIADFSGTRFAHDGMEAAFRTEDGAYFVTVTEKDGTVTDYPIHSVAGIAPLQQYLIETEPGRLQSFDVVWDAEQGRWYHLYPDQDLPPSDALHWTGPYKTWNARCAECHATGYEKRFDVRTQTYGSQQAEIGVGCEACHGPGSRHLAWAETAAQAEAGADPGDPGFSEGFEDTAAVIGQCAGCHSRREAFGDGNPVPGTPYHDAYNLALLRPGLYHADGQILDEVYVYGSFLQSKMYARGVGCLNCHDPHSARLVAEGNAVCTQCHSEAGNPEFPTLRKADYDTPEHHRHEVGTAGAQCPACHMIERTYMGIDGRRDHSFRVPRPDLAAETGGPDACTDCHAEEGADWAAARIEEWFPDSPHRGPQFGQVLARGRADPVAASGDLETLAADRNMPGIVRATALWLLEESGNGGAAARLAPLLNDPDPVVRAAAVRLQRTAPPMERIQRIASSLADPVRLVRMDAARGFLGAPIARLPQAMEANLQAAMEEWRGALANRFDFPETHLQLGGLALTLRDPQAATGAFREAVRLDPQRTDAWVMLVRIAAATEGADAAGAVLAEAREINPDDAMLAALQADLDAARQ